MEEASKAPACLLVMLKNLCESVVGRLGADCGSKMEDLLLFCNCISLRFVDMCFASGAIVTELHDMHKFLRFEVLQILRVWSDASKAKRSMSRATIFQSHIALICAFTIKLSQQQSMPESSEAIFEFFDSSAFVVAWHDKKFQSGSPIASQSYSVPAVFRKLQELRTYLIDCANALEIPNLNRLCDGLASNSLFPATQKECSRWSMVSNTPMLCRRTVSSEHPYPPASYFTETISFPGSPSINIFFDAESSTEDDRDVVVIGYPGCSEPASFHGPKGSKWPGVGCPALNIPGDTFTVEFQTQLNPSVVNWGFSFVAVAPVCLASAEILFNEFSHVGITLKAAQKVLMETCNFVPDARRKLQTPAYLSDLLKWCDLNNQETPEALAGAEPGLFQDSSGHIQVNLQTAETFLMNRSTQPVPTLIQEHPDFKEAIGDRASFCTVITRTTHRSRFSVVGADGSCFDLSSWSPLQPAGIVGKGRGAKLAGNDDGIDDDGSFTAFNLPTKSAEFSYCGHHFVPYIRGNSPVSHLFDDVIKQGHDFVYMATDLDADSDLEGLFLMEEHPMRLLVSAKNDMSEIEGHPGSWFEVHVRGNLIEVFFLFENGRNMHKRIVYSSDEHFCLSSLSKTDANLEVPPNSYRQHEAGSPFHGLFDDEGKLMEIPGVGALKHNNVSSISICRALSRPGAHLAFPAESFSDEGFPSPGFEEFVSPQNMNGIVPECLLDSHSFWRTSARSIRGFLKGAKDLFARSLLITLTIKGYAIVEELRGSIISGTLVNPKMQNFDTSDTFKPLVQFLTSLDSISHVLIWTFEGKISSVECPRIGLSFSLHSNGRLMLQDHDDMCLCLSPPHHLLQLLPDGAASRIVTLENSQGHYFFLTPNFGLKKRFVKACPFFNIPNIVRSKQWFNVMRKHYFLYPVHPSFSYLEQVIDSFPRNNSCCDTLQPTLSGAFYWSLVCFMSGNYVVACKTLNTACHTDVPLTKDQRWIVANFPDAGLISFCVDFP